MVFDRIMHTQASSYMLACPDIRTRSKLLLKKPEAEALISLRGYVGDLHICCSNLQSAVFLLRLGLRLDLFRQCYGLFLVGFSQGGHMSLVVRKPVFGVSD